MRQMSGKKLCEMYEDILLTERCKNKKLEEEIKKLEISGDHIGGNENGE